MRFSLLLLVVLFFAGCTTVTSRQLVGSEPYPIEDPKAWHGHWTILSEDASQPITITVANASEGILRMTYVQVPDTPAAASDTSVDQYPDVVSCLVQLRKQGDAVIGNMHTVDQFDRKAKTSEVESTDKYLWFLLELGKEGPMMAFVPEAAKLAKLVESKELTGTVKDGNVEFESLSSEQLTNLLESPESFTYRHPLVILKAPTH